jgi:hypothetical protein
MADTIANAAAVTLFVLAFAGAAFAAIAANRMEEARNMALRRIAVEAKTRRDS